MQLGPRGEACPQVPAKRGHKRTTKTWKMDILSHLSNDAIPEIDRSAHLLFSSDIHPACPNAVIEALACGLPVVAFDTGSLKELVPDTAGVVSPYGSDPWKLEKPDVAGLARGAAKILADLPHYRLGARAHAESALGLDKMVEGYLRVLKR